MFKKTPENPQFELFSTPSTQMGRREAKKYDDPDADYRKKGDQKVKGYSVNITETCNDTDDEKDKPNLIVNVQVKGASAADNDYLKEAITNIRENVSTDIMFMDKPCPTWKLSDNNRSKSA
ncbi:MAG: hypothetical protein LLF81_06350 [Porphyromonadaceae bacterium]|nr:hypothetical protein [Porphyromonadaceae bacterium]